MMMAKISIKEGTITELNTALVKKMSLTHTFSLSQQPISLLFPDNEKDNIKNALQKLQTKNKLSQYITNLLRSDKSTLSVSIDGLVISPALDDSDAILYFTDITGLKKAEKKIITNRDLLQNMINNAAVSIIFVSSEGTIVEWNEQTARLIGLHKNNAQQKYLWDVIHIRNNTPLLNEAFNAFKANKENPYFGQNKRFSIINQRHQRISVEISSFVVNQEDNDKIYCLFLHDISNELKARYQEIRLSSIVQNTQDAIITFSLNGKIETWNKGAEKTYGIASNKALNQSIYNIMPKDNSFQHYVAQLEKTEKPIHYEFSVQIKGQEKKYFLSGLDLIHFSKTRKWVSMIIRDITPLKIQQKKIETLMHELELSNQELQSFAYIVSHDLKEPLRGISNYVEIINDDFAEVLNENGKQFLNALSDSAIWMQKLLDSLMIYSKVGNLDLELQPCSPVNLLNKVEQSIHHKLKEKNALLSIHAPLPQIKVDEIRMMEVFTNLITNALKYNDKEQPVINIRYNEEKSNPQMVCLSVTDNGIGIQEKDIDAIFQIFRRLHKKNQYEGGAGAGLTITKRIIERQKGNIWVESDGQNGSTFFITLQRA